MRLEIMMKKLENSSIWEKKVLLLHSKEKEHLKMLINESQQVYQFFGQKVMNTEVTNFGQQAMKTDYGLNLYK